MRTSRISARPSGRLMRSLAIPRSKRSRWSSSLKKLPRQTWATSYVASERRNPQQRIGTRASATGTNRPSTKAAPPAYAARSATTALSTVTPLVLSETPEVYAALGGRDPLRTSRVTRDDIQHVEVGVEVTRDAVEQADGPAGEEELRRDAADARAELAAEALEGVVRAGRLAAKEHADDPQEGVEVGAAAYGQRRLAQRPRKGGEIPASHRAHDVAERGDEGRLEAEREAVVEEDELRAAPPGAHHEVARVRVGVENAARKELI